MTVIFSTRAVRKLRRKAGYASENVESHCQKHSELGAKKSESLKCHLWRKVEWKAALPCVRIPILRIAVYSRLLQVCLRIWCTFQASHFTLCWKLRKILNSLKYFSLFQGLWAFWFVFDTFDECSVKSLQTAVYLKKNFANALGTCFLGLNWLTEKLQISADLEIMTF